VRQSEHELSSHLAASNNFILQLTKRRRRYSKSTNKRQNIYALYQPAYLQTLSSLQQNM